MTARVISLRDYRVARKTLHTLNEGEGAGHWRALRVLCRGCDHIWIGVMPTIVGLSELQCPRCGAADSLATEIGGRR